MSDLSDNDEQDEQLVGRVQLKEWLNLNSVVTGGQSFEVNYDEDLIDDDIYNPKDVDFNEYADLCIEFESDEEDDERTPFEKLAVKMTNVTEDGKVKKLIKREGVDERPSEDSMVHILYTSFLEYSDEPTDFAFSKKPYKFRLGEASLVGLNYAVESMKLNEKSLFLIDPDLTFGKLGHPPRVPANSTFLFNIELVRIINNAAAKKFKDLTQNERRTFPIAYKTALALCENAKEYFKNSSIKLAIRDYNKGVALLEQCNLSDMDDQEKQQKLLFKLYTNLAVCYTKDSNPKRACIMINEIFKIVKDTKLTIPAKVYFHKGRALRMLGDYKSAFQSLKTAQSMDPDNYEIGNEISLVKQGVEEQKKIDMAFSSHLIQTGDNSKKQIVPEPDDEPVDNVFQAEIRNLCQNLKTNENQSKFILPAGLTEYEYKIAMNEVQRAGLFFTESKGNENDEELAYLISKTKITL